MRAIIIDSKNQTVTEDEYNGNYKDIYRLGDFSCFTVINLGEGEDLFVDDKGLFNESNTSFFELNGPDYRYPQPLAGNGVILGSNDEGESVATKLTLETVKANVKFRKLRIRDWTPGRSYNSPQGFVIEGPKPIFFDVLD